MARLHKPVRATGHTILVVDDNSEYLQATRLLVEREGHRVLTAENGATALQILHQEPVDLMLLDYFMPGMTGEEVVAQLRKFNPYVQVVLQTGYASEQPPLEMLRRLDIQGYYDKTEGPDKLLLWTEVGLKSAYTIQLLTKSRQGLRYILNITPDLHKIQPLDDLLQGILWQVAGLLGAVNSFLAVIPEGGILHPLPEESEGFVAMVEEGASLIIRASTGRFVNQKSVDESLEPEKYQWVVETLQKGESKIVNSSTVVPLRVGDLTLGVIYLDRPAVALEDKELVNIFANQAAVAIQNIELYEMATLDSLTGAYSRGFFDRWLLRELRTAFRSQQPLAFLMVDMDTMKRINDTAGHLIGDEALRILGKVLRDATRNSDIVGRYGGDEFAVVLPLTDAPGAERVAKRIFELLSTKSVAGPKGPISLNVSIGSAVLAPHTFAASEIPHPLRVNYFQSIAQLLIEQADHALYQSKTNVGSSSFGEPSVKWQTLPEDSGNARV